jgi:sirohydrochlorin cobaltochelatase
MTDATAGPRTGVVLVGHGAIPKDYPRDQVAHMRALEARRRQAGEPPSAEEQELEHRLRHWPRTPQNDPYQAGLVSWIRSLQPLLPDVSLALAYLEFCAPTLEETVECMRIEGISQVLVAPSMLTPGGVHSEVDIPVILERLRRRYPELELRYAWPFDQQLVARMLAEHLTRFHQCESIGV